MTSMTSFYDSSLEHFLPTAQRWAALRNDPVQIRQAQEITLRWQVRNLFVSPRNV